MKPEEIQKLVADRLSNVTKDRKYHKANQEFEDENGKETTHSYLEKLEKFFIGNNLVS